MKSKSSLSARSNGRTLKHVIQYSPLVPKAMGGTFSGSNSHENLKAAIKKHPDPILSELPLFLNKTATLEVPVYTTWGACEDVRVLEKFRAEEYKVDNLHIVDEHDSHLLEVGGLKLRLLGLGGAVVMHKLFDNGEGRTTIAGGQGTMWTTVLQMGELIETALATFDRSETRIFVSHMSPGREGLLAQLALALRVLPSHNLTNSRPTLPSLLVSTFDMVRHTTISLSIPTWIISAIALQHLDPHFRMFGIPSSRRFFLSFSRPRRSLSTMCSKLLRWPQRVSEVSPTKLDSRICGISICRTQTLAVWSSKSRTARLQASNAPKASISIIVEQNVV